jgi:hypothetical protein
MDGPRRLVASAKAHSRTGADRNDLAVLTVSLGPCGLAYNCGLTWICGAQWGRTAAAFTEMAATTVGPR